MTYENVKAEKFVNKIKPICKSKKIKLGTLERKVGVSPGYFSRQPIVPLGIAIATAQLLDMTIEDICEYNPKLKELEEARRRVQQLEQEIEKEK